MFHSLKNAGRFEERDYYCAGDKMYFDHLIRRTHYHRRPGAPTAAACARWRLLAGNLDG